MISGRQGAIRGRRGAAPSRAGRTAVRVLVIAVLGLLSLEGIVRVRQYLRHGITERTVFARERDGATGLLVPVPSSVAGGISINSDGWRGPELETPKPEGRVRIAFLGGSTTFCADVSGNDAAWPHLVSEALAERSLAWFLVEKNLRVRERRRGAGDGRLEVPVTELVTAFEARLDELLLLARAFAPVVAICTFQTRARLDQPADVQARNLSSALYSMPCMDRASLMAGYAEYNRAVRDAARRHGAVLVELDGAIPGDAEHFVDSVHVTDAGSARMAERVAAVLGSDPRVRGLLDWPRVRGARGRSLHPRERMRQRGPRRARAAASEISARAPAAWGAAPAGTGEAARAGPPRGRGGMAGAASARGPGAGIRASRTRSPRTGR